MPDDALFSHPDEAIDLRVHAAVCGQRYRRFDERMEAMKLDIERVATSVSEAKSELRNDIAAVETRTTSRLDRIEKIMIGVAGSTILTLLTLLGALGKGLLG